MHRFQILALSLFSVAFVPGPQPPAVTAHSGNALVSAASILPSWEEHERVVSTVRRELLKRLKGLSDAAKKQGDSQSCVRLEADRAALERDGTWPEELEATELQAMILKARKRCLEALDGASVRLRQRRRGDAADALARFREHFAETNYLGAPSALLQSENLELPSGWSRTGKGVVSPSAAEGEAEGSPLVLGSEPATSRLLALEVERREGEGPLRLELPDCGGGRLQLTIGRPNATAGGTGSKARDPFGSNPVSLFLQWGNAGVHVLCDGHPMVRADGLEWSVVEGDRVRHGPSALVVSPADGATRFVLRDLELRALSSWPEETLSAATAAKGSPTGRAVDEIDTELVQGSRWIGELKLDGAEIPCSATVESRDGERVELLTVGGRLSVRWFCTLDGTRVLVDQVMVVRDGELTTGRLFSEPRFRGKIQRGRLRLDGDWHQQHPRAGTGRKSVELDLTPVS